MGMFDYFKSSYDLGEEFTNVVCQTKDLDRTMTDYWLDPAGVLWCPSYTGTNTLEVYEKGHPKYDESRLWFNYEWIPTGEHGKFSPHLVTKYITIYPERTTNKYAMRPELKLLFKQGKLREIIRLRPVIL
jgi:hypothetical protein